MKQSLRLLFGALCVSLGLNATAQSSQEPTHLPYYNYRGITDLGDAKRAWMLENPEAYRAYVAQSQANTPAPASTATVVPNDDTRLPYYRYNGIQDLAEAKKAWLRDNPPATQNAQPAFPQAVQVEQDPTRLPYYNYNGIADIEAAKRAWVADQQNAHLPWFNFNGIRDIAAAKAAYRAASPAAYDQYVASQAPQQVMHRISLTEFNQMPEAKRQHILQNLNRYEIVDDTPNQGATPAAAPRN